MNLIRWNPRDFSVLHNQMSRFFEDVLQDWPSDLTGPAAWNPVADIYETDDKLIVKAELPGVDPKMVDVRLEGAGKMFEQFGFVIVPLALPVVSFFTTGLEATSLTTHGLF